MRTPQSILSVAALAAGLLLQGCVSSARLPSGTQATAHADTGIVFGTIGVSAQARTVELSSLQLRRVLGYRTQPFGELVFHSPVGIAGRILSPIFDTPVDFSGAEGKGTLFVARLPAGQYEVISAGIENAPMGGWAAHVYTADAGSVPFHVEAGKATYLGQFLSHLRMGYDAHRIPEVKGAYFVVSDQLPRDLPLLRARGESAAAAQVINLAPRFMRVENAALRSRPE